MSDLHIDESLPGLGKDFHPLLEVGWVFEVPLQTIPHEVSAATSEFWDPLELALVLEKPVEPLRRQLEKLADHQRVALGHDASVLAAPYPVCRQETGCRHIHVLQGTVASVAAARLGR